MFQTDFLPAELKARRDTLCDALGDSVALIAGAEAPLGSSPFRQYNGFYYLCGVEVPHAYLAIDGRTRTTTLFLPPASMIDKDHDGRVLSADDPAYVAETSGVDQVLGLGRLNDFLGAVNTVYTYLQNGEGEMSTPESTKSAAHKVDADPWDGRLNRGAHFVARIRARYPKMAFRDVAPLVKPLRLIKSVREIELCRRAGRLSALGLCEAMRATRPGVMEYQLDAVLRYHYLAGGARGAAYSAIVGGGVNAFHGHYHLNSSALKDGDMVLVDCGPDYRYYSSDITRMWPVNGTYTPAQRALYGFVTEYHKALLNAIRPGRVYAEIEEEAREIMRGRLNEFEFASPVHAAGAEWMFNFNSHLAHSVGMSVHDGRDHYKEPLRPGTIFAVDPQMRIEAERLYLRVEDTGVVTEDGFEVFTRDVPLELDDIEKLIKEDGILTSFPPLQWND
ncbi:MAG: aminopeptidase P N-terminal domain-containing protein [Verrucomicrobia bacterium]|nr:aminopeptidase P N-terminal domain-containing protein [Verrucomicrobiota bacterium]